MSELKWVLGDLSGNPRSSLTGRLPGGQVHIALDDQCTASVSVPFEDEAAVAATPFDSALKVYLNDSLIFRGPVTLPRDEGPSGLAAGAKEIAATDPSVHLEESHPVAGGLLGFEGGPPTPSGEITGDVATLIEKIVHNADHGMFASGLAFGLNPRTNGIAASVVRHGSDPHMLHRSPADGSTLWELITDDIGVLPGGPEVTLEPLDGLGDMAQFHTWYPRLGSDRTDEVVFEYNLGRHNLGGFANEPGGGQITNCYTLVGPAQDTAFTIGSKTYTEASAIRAVHAGSIAQYGMYDDYEDGSELCPDPFDTDPLIEPAVSVVAARAFPVPFIELTPTVERGGYVNAWGRSDSGVLMPIPAQGLGAPPLAAPDGDYWLGDTVRVLARQRPGLNLDTAARVTEITLTEVDDAGTVVVELVVTPVNADATGVTWSSVAIVSLQGSLHGHKHKRHHRRRSGKVHPVHRPGPHVPGHGAPVRPLPHPGGRPGGASAPVHPDPHRRRHPPGASG